MLYLAPDWINTDYAEYVWLSSMIAPRILGSSCVIQVPGSKVRASVLRNSMHKRKSRRDQKNTLSTKYVWCSSMMILINLRASGIIWLAPSSAPQVHILQSAQENRNLSEHQPVWKISIHYAGCPSKLKRSTQQEIVPNLFCLPQKIFFDLF